MQLRGFQIKNYKSISDTGLVSLSAKDNVTVLAGQNESGKSSILRAIFDFEQGKFSDNSLPFSTEGEKEQAVSCLYQVEENADFFRSLNDITVEEKKIEVPEGTNILDEGKIRKIKDFKLTRKIVKGEVILEIDTVTFNIFAASILKQPNDQNASPVVGENPTIVSEPKKYIELKEEDNAVVANIFWKVVPPIVFFDDFCDLLPDKIFISALKEEKIDTQGYRAVKNLEKILDINFVKKDVENDPIRRTKESADNNQLSINFQEDWGQRIHDENEVVVKYNFEKRDGEGENGSYINFYVETKEGQPLSPKQRSKGLIWFLSLWLELKAQDLQYEHMVLLLDEPDQHLHVKAQKDILKLINRLATGGDQIIYATHSPYLLEVDRLNRIKLIINTKDHGTSIEDVTTSKIDSENKRDALQPIADAIGLHMSEFSPLGNRNVILEGVSDFYYFAAMKKLSGRTDDYSFVPGIGVRKVNSLISLCVGYGLQWAVVIDADPATGGKDSLNKFNEIRDYVFDGDDTKARTKIHILKGIVGVENMFTFDDLKLVDTRVQQKPDKTEVVGQRRKVLFAKTFYEKVNAGEITDAKISKTAKNNFAKVFDFIESALK